MSKAVTGRPVLVQQSLGRLFSNKRPREHVERIDLGKGSWLLYSPALWDAREAEGVARDLLRELPWERREVVVHGKRVVQPRMVTYQAAEPGLAYTYSRVQVKPEPWHPLVLKIKERVEAATEATFNSCLLNLYRDGADKMSWHSDNEAPYGPEPTIASVSFGVPRDFVLRSNADRSVKRSFALGDGALLVMGGTTQQHWMHSVPPRAKVQGPRINLTFRNVLWRERVIEPTSDPLP